MIELGFSGNDKTTDSNKPYDNHQEIIYTVGDKKPS